MEPLIQEIETYIEANTDQERQSKRWSIGLSHDENLKSIEPGFKKWKCYSSKGARDIFDFFVEQKDYDCDTINHDRNESIIYVFQH